jgi:membrane-associated protein
MISGTILHLVDHYGYLIFYLAFCLGPFGIPVPNEVTILTGGILADNGALNPWIIYACILLGLLTAVTIGYFCGRLFGQQMVVFLQKNKVNRYWIKVENLFNKYGDIAMCVGFLLPVVRYVVPVFAGINGVKYKKFALFSYISSIVWTALFFTIGKAYGDQLSQLLSLVDVKSLVIVVFLAVLIVALSKIKIHKPKDASQALVHE